MIKKLISIILLIFVIINAYAGIFENEEETKHSLAVLPFENLTGNHEFNDIVNDVSHIMFQYLYKYGKFRLIEMENISDIVGEDFPDGKLLKRDDYLKAVKSLGVELILYGNIRQIDTFSDNKKHHLIKTKIDARLVRLLNGEIIFMETAVGEIKIEPQKLISMNDKLLAIDKAIKKLAKIISKQ
ncbi:hypothetical protein BVX93_01085 [bacterium B13(2017)]|nr:hypothetical protein BVX93_01085 [bacterium B13(2017)]